MPTTLTTDTVMLEDGSRYKPTVWRAFAETSLTIGSSHTYKRQTHNYRAARVHWKIDGLTADTTLTLQVDSGPVQALTVSNKHGVKSSTGALVLRFTTTGTGNAVFPGLDRWTELRLVNATTSALAESTGIFIDVELIGDPVQLTRTRV